MPHVQKLLRVFAVALIVTTALVFVLARVDVEAARIRQLGTGVDPAIQSINVTALLPISDTQPGDGISKTIYFSNAIAGVISLTFSISGTPAMTLTAGSAFGDAGQTYTSSTSPWSAVITYGIEAGDTSDPPVPYTATNTDGLQTVVAITYVRDVTAPIVSDRSVTTTAEHLLASGTMLYYTDTQGVGEFFSISGRSVDEGAGCSVTLFSAVNLGCGTAAPPPSIAPDWSAEYCLRGVPAGRVITAASYDYLGNTREVSFTLQPDGRPPTSSVTASITQSVGRAPFSLTWIAHDEDSGVYSITLHDKTGDNWQVSTDTLALGRPGGTFTFTPPDDLFVNPVITYSFATVAKDNLGNLETLPTVPDAQLIVRLAKVYLSIVINTFPLPPVVNNGNFANGLAGWQVNGGLGASPAVDPDDPSNPVGLIGSPAWPCSNGVPLDFSSLTQSIRVPQPGAGQSAKLKFRYRILTQDRNTTLGNLFDSFDVLVDGALVLRDANTTLTEGCGAIHDLDWKPGEYTFTSAHYGRTMPISFAVYNRGDRYYNTYVYLDDVQVVVEP